MNLKRVLKITLLIVILAEEIKSVGKQNKTSLNSIITPNKNNRKLATSLIRQAVNLR